MVVKPKLVAGLDEVGAGAMAGALLVVVAAFKESTTKPEGVKDSKQLSPAKREALVDKIISIASFVGFGFASPWCIDTIGMGRAWNLAASMALDRAPPFKELIVDGEYEVERYQGTQRAVIKGDQHHWQVSAASILAKVMRDREMRELHSTWPTYRFCENMGYGTQVHRQALLEIGPCPIHRRLFLRKLLRETQYY